MVVPWQAAVMVIGLTGLPHPDIMHRWGTMVLNALPMDTDLTFAPSPSPFDMSAFGDADTQPVEPVSPQAVAAAALIFAIMFLAAYWGPQLLFACIFKMNVTDKRPKLAYDRTMADGQFHYGLCECFANINDAMIAFCCPSVKFADTHGEVTGSFWGSLCLFVGANLVIWAVAAFGVPAAYPMPQLSDNATMADLQAYPQEVASWTQNLESIENIIQCVLRGLIFGIYTRKQLREKLGDPNPSAGAFMDFIAWGFCTCCALTQESVEVDIANKVTVGCCSILEGRQGVRAKAVKAREVAPCNYEKLLGDAVVLEEGGR